LNAHNSIFIPNVAATSACAGFSAFANFSAQVRKRQLSVIQKTVTLP
jgi:hypothetical protein